MATFKLLTFSLGEESYGVPITKVKEIIGLLSITHVPHSPKFLKGIINLRGTVIPVVDLRIRLGLAEKEYDERTCILVMDISRGEHKRNLGIIVDFVSEVISISDEDIDAPPQYSSQNSQTKYISGIGKIQDRILVILDVEKMFMYDEIKEMLENVK